MGAVNCNCEPKLLRDTLSHYRAKFGLPVWLVEFNCGNGWWDCPNEQHHEYMKETLPMLEEMPWVVRYNWMAALTETQFGALNSNVAPFPLTELGETYNQFVWDRVNTHNPQWGDNAGEPILDCNCDRKPANGPDAESLCQEVGKKTIKMLFTCPSNPSNFRLFSGKCKKVSKAKAFSMPQPCGQLNCSCGNAVAALAAERAAHVQCWSAAKKPTYRMFCDTNANGVWDSGESRRDSKIKCRNDGSLKRHSFGNFSC